MNSDVFRVLFDTKHLNRMLKSTRYKGSILLVHDEGRVYLMTPKEDRVDGEQVPLVLEPLKHPCATTDFFERLDADALRKGCVGADWLIVDVSETTIALSFE